MPRFYLPTSAIRGNAFFLSGTEAHHAIHVLRHKVGDLIDLFDGEDLSFRGRIESIHADEIRGVIIEEHAAVSLPVQVTLYQALTRGSKWEWLLEKACEIGVSRLVPVHTQRTLVKLEDSQVQAKVDRWNRIALSASKQSGRAHLMQVASPESLTEALGSRGPSSLSIIPWEKETSTQVKQACAGFKGQSVNIFIGPEGGWEGLEVQQAIEAGVKPVRLGPTLLRTETAGLVTVTLVLREFGIY